jgi:hypothetical protein
MRLFVWSKRVCSVALAWFAVSILLNVWLEQEPRISITNWATYNQSVYFSRASTIDSLAIALIAGVVWAWRWDPRLTVGLGVVLFVLGVVAYEKTGLLGPFVALVFVEFISALGGIVLFMVAVLRLIVNLRTRPR